MDKGQLYRYDRLGINVIVDHQKGGICNCDIPYSDDIQQFSNDYDRITQQAAIACQNITDDSAQIDGSHATRFLERLQQTINELT